MFLAVAVAPTPAGQTANLTEGNSSATSRAVRSLADESTTMISMGRTVWERSCSRQRRTKVGRS